MSSAAARIRAALAVLIAWALPQAGAADEIVVAGAVSLRAPLQEIVRRYEATRPGVRLVLTSGASSFLAAQLRAGAPIDLLVAADTRIVDDLVSEGLVNASDRQTLATNRLVAMARPGLSPSPTNAAALATPGIRRIAMPDGAVPVGRYAREWLARRGLLDRLAPRFVLTEHARATLAAVDAGHADVALVYATDARLARHATIAFEIPAAEQPRIVYGVALVRDAAPEAAGFFSWLASPTARQILQRAGFGAP